MVEMAIGVTIFLTATLGAVQLGVSALASEGAQSAALVGARTASSSPVTGQPVARLYQGQSAAVASLRAGVLGLAQAQACSDHFKVPDACGLPLVCVEYQGDRPLAGTTESCSTQAVTSGSELTLGPSPENLDGSQNPTCRSADCFGVAQSMAPCSSSESSGRLVVCLAYTSWPAKLVDIWIRGAMRSLVPMLSGAGLDALPVKVRLRLQVEALAS
jgi:hypothetical protein